MRAVVQRVTRASVRVDGAVVGEVAEPGLVVLLGVTHDDGPAQVETIARKVAELRILRGERSAVDARAPVLVVSQFTLYGDTRKGRRPTWNAAAPGPVAAPLVDAVVHALRGRGLSVATGVFGADMAVELVNDGPVTILLEAQRQLSATRAVRCGMWVASGRVAAVRIEVVRGDLTREAVDAVVNAANSSLLGGGGVDGAIHAAAGPRLLTECRVLRRTSLPDGLPVGDAVATGAGELPARWVVHTVGPNAHVGERDPALLASCFTRSLDVAADLGARSVAFPAVSAGAYGWDVREVARVAVDAVRGWAAGRSGADRAVVLVRFVLFNRAALAAFRDALRDAR